MPATQLSQPPRTVDLWDTLVTPIRLTHETTKTHSHVNTSDGAVSRPRSPSSTFRLPSASHTRAPSPQPTPWPTHWWSYGLECTFTVQYARKLQRVTTPTAATPTLIARHRLLKRDSRRHIRRIRVSTTRDLLPLFERAAHLVHLELLITVQIEAVVQPIQPFHVAGTEAELVRGDTELRS